jgi:hypothetical protein
MQRYERYCEAGTKKLLSTIKSWVFGKKLKKPIGKLG